MGVVPLGMPGERQAFRLGRYLDEPLQQRQPFRASPPRNSGASRCSTRPYARPWSPPSRLTADCTPTGSTSPPPSKPHATPSWVPSGNGTGRRLSRAGYLGNPGCRPHDHDGFLDLRRGLPSTLQAPSTGRPPFPCPAWTVRAVVPMTLTASGARAIEAFVRLAPQARAGDARRTRRRRPAAGCRGGRCRFRRERGLAR